MDCERSERPPVDDEGDARRGPLDRSIVDCFADQARRRRDHPAVKTDRATLTYGELDRASDELARRVGFAARPGERRVAILLEQDIGYLVAIIGVLKSGSVYVPLDPSYPAARTGYMVEDAGAELIVTNAKNRELARKLARERCRILDLDEETRDPEPGIKRPPIAADQLAYILYTSGSTGQPKGVPQTHRNLIHHIRNYARGLAITAADRLSFFYSYCFSASLMDIFGALLHGATLYPRYLGDYPIADLADWLDRERITVYHSIPSVFRQLMGTLDAGRILGHVRAIDLAGEPLHQSDLDQFMRHFAPPCTLVNHMALTECSVCAQFTVTHDTQVPEGVVPVGFEAEGVRLLVVDEVGAEAGPDEVGELAVQSSFLSLGYWNKPELTQALFRSSGPGSPRTYFTGDLARKSADGCVTHLGRRDSRVKVRGYTIEVAEIENRLLEHPRVKEAIVVARPNERDQLRLVGYFVAKGNPAPNVSQLRRHLRSRLPDFMLPSVFVPLAALPVTPNGKVDRRALPDPDGRRPDLDSAYSAPRSGAEARLVAIWQRILGVTPVGVDDNFFELGGDSLLAVNLMAAIERDFAISLPLSTLVQAPTIARMAESILERQGKGAWRALVPIRALGPKRPIFFVHCGQGNVFRYHELAEYLDAWYPVHALQPQGLDGTRRVLRDVEEMAAQYLEEIRSVQPTGPYVLGGFSFGGLVAYEMARRLGKEAALVCLFDTNVFPEFGISASKTRQHLANVMRNQTKDSLAYALSKIRGQARTTMDGLKARLGRLPGELRLLLGRPIPVAERPNFFRRLAERASRRYHPAPFPGNLLFFEGTDDFAAKWRPFATGHFEVCDIQCPHDSMLRAPFIELVARRLNRALAEVDEKFPYSG